MKRRHNYTIFLLINSLVILGLGQMPLQAQEIAARYVTQVNNDSFKEAYILDAQYWRVFQDFGDSLSFEEVEQLEQQGKFKPYDALQMPFAPFQTYWVAIDFESSIAKDSEWILFLGFVSNAEVIIRHQDKSLSRQAAGIFVPNEVLAPNEGQVPKARILLKGKSRTRVFVKFHNKLPYPPLLELALQSQNSWQRSMNQTNFVQGLFQGLLWMILLYNLFLYLSIRDRTYLYYVCYVLFVSLYFLNEYEYLEEYILTRQPVLSFHLANLVYVALIFYLQFNRYFLKVPDIFPKWDRALQIWLFISIAFGILSFPLSYFAFDWYVPIRNYYHIFYALAIVLFIALTYAMALRYRDRIAAFFVAGNFFVFLGGIFIVLGNLGIVPFSLYYLLFGIMGQLFVFSMALSYRFQRNIREREEVQAQLIEQLKTNEQLQLDANQKLEQKVRERTAEIAHQKEEIEAQNEEISHKSEALEVAYNKITDSIRYAQRLQRAILGDEQEMTSGFAGGFVFFLPRDIVSGDFYWSSQIGHQRVVIAADCTGHGIPGALMTILGNSVLNDVINEERVISPERILYELDKKVVNTIQKQTSGKHPNDGMDMVVLVFDELSHIVRFAGAKNPLYYVRDGEMQRIKGSNFPIGIYKFRREKEFELHTFPYHEGDVFYLASDGFQDQFGGSEGRKYLKKRFREFLLEISHLPMPEQKQRLEDEFYEWQGKYPQTDDVLVIGIKV